MAKDTQNRKSNFPLTLHPTGQWCKKIRGKLHYFGDDKQKAHRSYLEAASDLHAGHQSRQKIGAGQMSVKDLANHYLDFQQERVEGGDITHKHYRDCHEALSIFRKQIGEAATLAELTPNLLARFRTYLLKKYAPSSANRHLGAIKAMFNYASDVDLIDRLPPMKKTLARVPVKRLRQYKAEKQREHGVKAFTPDEVRTLLGAANVQLKAMILLGVNGGFGNKDCSELMIKDVDFNRAVIDFVRGKTGIRRTVPLWPETVAALHEAIATRPKPKNVEDIRRVFLTPRGYLWVRSRERRKENGAVDFVPHDELNKQFDELLQALGMVRPGRSFYALRHTHATLADKARDLHAQKRIMGHALSGMLSEYIEDIELERLQKVVNVVRSAVYSSQRQEAEPVPSEDTEQKPSEPVSQVK